MKKFAWSCALGLVGLVAATSTQAADIAKPVLKAAPPARAGDWTGFYVGVQGGGGWGHAEQTDSSPFSSGTYNISGGLAGLTWGFNWQVGNTVVGFESDAAWSNIRGSTDGANGFNGPCGGLHCEAKLQWFGSNRLRLGYAFDRWLPYVTGGMAWGYVHGSEGNGGSPSGSGAELHYGWAAGGGVEAMIAPHWSAKVEYLYADLRDGKAFTDSFGGGAFFADQSVRMQVHIVRGGINYRFDPGVSLAAFLPPNPGPSAGPWNWGGLYVGANYGGGAGRVTQSDSISSRGTYDVGGAIIGGTVGYNWQRGNLVYGLEGDIDYSWIKGATSGTTGATACGGSSALGRCDTQLQWLGTARARLGVTWDRLLPYVTAGLAVGSLKSSEGDPPAAFTGSGSATRAGWTAGAGIEARIDNRWSAKLEYLYVDLGSGTVFNETTTGGATVSENVTFRTHIWRSGINYRFN